MDSLKFLGLRVRDLATGFEGVITSISFDISGCIQALITPGLDDTGKPGDSRWFDLKRLKVLNARPIIAQPTFEIIPGGQDLPGIESKPSF